MQIRILDPSEHALIPPEALGGHELPAGNCVVAAAFDGPSIVAVWCAVAVVHLEPLWIAEGHRHSPFILRRLWDALMGAMSSLGVRRTFTVISPAVPVTEKIAEWCGAEKIDGALWAMNMTKESFQCPQQ